MRASPKYGLSGVVVNVLEDTAKILKESLTRVYKLENSPGSVAPKTLSTAIACAGGVASILAFVAYSVARVQVSITDSNPTPRQRHLVGKEKGSSSMITRARVTFGTQVYMRHIHIMCSILYVYTDA